VYRIPSPKRKYRCPQSKATFRSCSLHCGRSGLVTQFKNQINIQKPTFPPIAIDPILKLSLHFFLSFCPATGKLLCMYNRLARWVDYVSQCVFSYRIIRAYRQAGVVSFSCFVLPLKCEDIEDTCIIQVYAQHHNKIRINTGHKI